MTTQASQHQTTRPHQGRQHWARLCAHVGARFASNRAGRVLLHVACVMGDHQVVWHLKGIARELSVPALLSH